METLIILDYMTGTLDIINNIPPDKDIDEILKEYNYKESDVSYMYATDVKINIGNYKGKTDE